MGEIGLPAVDLVAVDLNAQVGSVNVFAVDAIHVPIEAIIFRTRTSLLRVAKPYTETRDIAVNPTSTVVEDFVTILNGKIPAITNSSTQSERVSGLAALLQIKLPSVAHLGEHVRDHAA